MHRPVAVTEGCLKRDPRHRLLQAHLLPVGWSTLTGPAECLKVTGICVNLGESQSLNNAGMNSGASGNKDLISKLTDIILSNLENEKFGGEELAREAGLRISVLNRNV